MMESPWWNSFVNRILTGDLEGVKSYAEGGPFDHDSLIESLGIALQEDQPSIVRYLLSLGKIEKEVSSSLLHDAIQDDSYDSIKVMVETEAITPDQGLIVAAQVCRPKYVRYFIEQGATSFDQALQSINTGSYQYEDDRCNRTRQALTRLQAGLPFKLRRDEENWSTGWKEQEAQQMEREEEEQRHLQEEEEIRQGLPPLLRDLSPLVTIEEYQQAFNEIFMMHLKPKQLPPFYASPLVPTFSDQLIQAMRDIIERNREKLI